MGGRQGGIVWVEGREGRREGGWVEGRGGGRREAGWVGERLVHVRGTMGGHTTGRAFWRWNAFITLSRNAIWRLFDKHYLSVVGQLRYYRDGSTLWLSQMMCTSLIALIASRSLVMSIQGGFHWLGMG